MKYTLLLAIYYSIGSILIALNNGNHNITKLSEIVSEDGDENNEKNDNSNSDNSREKLTVQLNHPVVRAYVSDHTNGLHKKAVAVYPHLFHTLLTDCNNKGDSDPVRKSLSKDVKALKRRLGVENFPPMSLPIEEHFLPGPDPNDDLSNADDAVAVPEYSKKQIVDIQQLIGQISANPIASLRSRYPENLGPPENYPFLSQFREVPREALAYEFASPQAAASQASDWNEYQPHRQNHLGNRHPCYHSPCLNGGRCFLHGSHHHVVRCKCEEGFTGHYCEIPIISCHPNPCLNGGTCTKSASGIFCSCVAEYKKEFCQVQSECAKSPCEQGGRCLELEDDFFCECDKPYKGKDCSERASPCFSNPCKNGGTCQDKNDGFTCVCQAEFSCDDCSCPATSKPTKRPALACPPDTCKNGGTCIIGQDGFLCNCLPGYHGDQCAMPDLCNPNPCDNGGFCVQEKNDYKCICPYGYKGSNCGAPLSCGAHPCTNGGVCHETDNSFTCKCRPGYKGKTCKDLNPCSKSPCINSATCEEKGTLFTCHCKPGYRGGQCREKDPCFINPCQNGQCSEANRAVTCNCTAGWIGDFCEVRDECNPNKCLNGGTCVHHGDTYKCICTVGYDGPTCELSSPCYPNPCRNNAFCNVKDIKIGSYNCICKDKYSGQHCEVPSRCHPSPCINNGVCFEGDNDFICDCPNGHTGKHCQIQDFCDPNPCLNGGRCVEGIGKFSCTCNPGWMGPQCDVNICNPNPCRSGGVCVPSGTVHGYACQCTFPFHGHDCQDIDPCVPNPCKNHGRCKSHLQKVEQLHLDSGLIPPSDDSVVSIVGNQQHHNGGIEEHQDDFHIFDRDNADKSKTAAVREEIENAAKHSDGASQSEKASSAVNKDLVKEITASVLQAMLRHPSSGSALQKRTLQDLYVCECDIGFLGAYCQHINPCASTPCTNGGTCIPRGEKFQCHCPVGYGGLNCKDLHPCDPNPCQHTGVCTISHGIRGFHCDCQDGWKGYTCERKDICAKGNPCQNNGKCVSVQNGIECHCRPRFKGSLCEVDKCEGCDKNAICNHGHCVCKSGHIGNGFKCKAMGDLCVPNPCENNGKCVEGQEGKIFTCQCKRGFTGSRCEYPNPCIQMPCQHNGVCVDSSNGKDKGVVVLDQQDYKCFCPQGYRGKNCEVSALAACSSAPCLNNATCFDSSDENHRKTLQHIDDYACFCQKGYSGKQCEVSRFACWNYPCLNGGSCIDAESMPDVSFDSNGFKCNCLASYKGRNCQITMSGPSPCASQPCQRNGKCVDMTTSMDGEILLNDPQAYHCLCEPIYSGKNCEVPYPACYSNPCLHNGTCMDKSRHNDMSFDESGYHCICESGYEGRNCERQFAFMTSDEDTARFNALEDQDINPLSPTSLVVQMKSKRTTPRPLAQRDSPEIYELTELKKTGTTYSPNVKIFPDDHDPFEDLSHPTFNQRTNRRGRSPTLHPHVVVTPDLASVVGNRRQHSAQSSKPTAAKDRITKDTDPRPEAKKTQATAGRSFVRPWSTIYNSLLNKYLYKGKVKRWTFNRDNDGI